MTSVKTLNSKIRVLCSCQLLGYVATREATLLSKPSNYNKPSPTSRLVNKTPHHRPELPSNNIAHLCLQKDDQQLHRDPPEGPHLCLQDQDPRHHQHLAASNHHHQDPHHQQHLAASDRHHQDPHRGYHSLKCHRVLKYSNCDK